MLWLHACSSDYRDDLSRLARQWYNWTKIMRTDMEVRGAADLMLLSRQE